MLEITRPATADSQKELSCNIQLPKMGSISFSQDYKNKNNSSDKLVVSIYSLRITRGY